MRMAGVGVCVSLIHVRIVYSNLCELDSVAGSMSRCRCGPFQSHIRLLFGLFICFREATLWLP